MINRLSKLIKNIAEDQRNLAILIILTLIAALLYVIFSGVGEPGVDRQEQLNVVEENSEKIVFEAERELTDEEKRELESELTEQNPNREIEVRESFPYSEEKKEALELKYQEFEFDEELGEWVDPDVPGHTGQFGEGTDE